MAKPWWQLNPKVLDWPVKPCGSAVKQGPPPKSKLFSSPKVRKRRSAWRPKVVHTAVPFAARSFRVVLKKYSVKGRLHSPPNELMAGQALKVEPVKKMEPL